jgi:hypothetical protein
MLEIKFAEKFETKIYDQKLFSENHGVFDIMWKNMVQTGRP